MIMKTVKTRTTRTPTFWDSPPLSDNSDNGLSPGRCQAITWTNVVNWTHGNTLQWNINRNLYIFIHEKALEIVVRKLAANFSRPDVLKKLICGYTRGPISIDQSHRYERHQAACREPAGSYDKTTRTAICFEHKTQYLLIRAPYTRIVVFWHISNRPPMISQSQISCNTPRFIKQQYLWNIAIQQAVDCYNSWANLWCSGCYPLGENYYETGL